MTRYQKAILASFIFISGALCSSAQTVKADELMTTCSGAAGAVRNKAGQGKPEQWKWEKDRPDAIYNAGWCSGYVRGTLQSMDGLVVPSNKPVVLHIKNEQIKSEWDVVAAFIQYMNANPLAKGKSADVVLLTVLSDHDMVETTTFIAPANPEVQTTDSR